MARKSCSAATASALRETDMARTTQRPLALSLSKGLLALALAVPCALQADIPPPSPSPTIVGGFHELRPSDPELAAVAAFVVPRLGRPRARLGAIIGGEKQVVAGANYRIMLQLTDGSRWRAEVWKKLDGSMVMKRFGAVG
jgi:hypothetical protein